MLKGYRTYIAAGLTLVASALPMLGIDKNISEAAVAFCLALVVYFRKVA